MRRRAGLEAIVSRKRFKEIIRDYDPLPFETLDDTDPQYRIPMHHLLKNEARFWKTLNTASKYFPSEEFSIADVGTYPGSLLRVLFRLLGPNKVRLLGVGLLTSEDFTRVLAEDCGAEIFTVNLDPRNNQLRHKNYPTYIPVEDNSIDFIFALEIVEHLVSPSHMFAEAFRVCRPGGYLLVTTPNVTRIGNVFKLLAGRSNFDRLISPDYYNPDDEWRPHFREYTIDEIGEYFVRAGFQIRQKTQTVMDTTRYNVKSVRQRFIDLAKNPFFIVPHLREELLIVGEKPGKPLS